ncbi:MAG: ABC transporter substrate-binding protein [Candidatus Melainabacteria bacterium]|jgi:ABC-type nitrate/sulfonate/bicarbonate transport system substrate-binding protein|nr:ABC transporter substrate-binding protein [Candidatus Melainabacteria bacterium]
MKVKPLTAILSAFVLTVLAWVLFSYIPNAKSQAERVPIRIGWQLATATQGQLVEVLKRTNLLDRLGLDPTFVPFSYGEPEVAAALKGNLDVMFSSGQSVNNLLARGGKWKVVARLHFIPAALMVPPDSPIKEIKDLRGKTVACTFGTIGHREATLKEEAAGLNPDKDVNHVNMDILEIQKLVEAGGREKWGKFDAVALWEPDISMFKNDHAARVLSSHRAVYLVSVSDKFIANNRAAAIHFLRAIAQSWQFYNQFRERVNQWYIDDSQFGFTSAALTSAAKEDPNFAAKSLADIDLHLTDEGLRILDIGAKWSHERGYTQSLVPIRQAIDQTLIDAASKGIAGASSEQPEVILPSTREVAVKDESGDFLGSVPLIGIFLLQVAVTLCAIEAGQWLGARRARLPENERESESAVSAVSGAVLALLAFILALTFGAAASRYDLRRDALMGDVNAIQATYMRAGLVPDPYRTVTRSLLRDYVEVRMNIGDVYGDADQLRALRARSSALTDMLWSQAEELAAKDSNDIYALFSEGITDMVEYQNKRIAFGANFRIPTFVWVILMLTSCISMFTMGFQFGITGRRSFPSQLALVVTFALVIQLIYDLDSPGKGFVHLNQQPMIDLYRSLSK